MAGIDLRAVHMTFGLPRCSLIRQPSKRLVVHDKPALTSNRGSMEFGINNLFSGRQDTDASRIYRDSLDQIVLAEELGFTSAWIAEHHFSSYGLLPHLPTFAAAAAALTTKIRLATAVLVLPFGHPLRLAEEMAMVDVISGGRLELGVGRGYQPQEFAALGVNPEHSQAIFDEYLEIMRLAWSQERISFEGEHFSVSTMSRCYQSRSNQVVRRCA